MNDQQTKCGSERKAITSLILGIVTMSSTFPIFLGLFISNILSPFIFQKLYFLSILAGLMSPVFIITGIIGLILGVKGLKSVKRKLSIAGIVLNIVGLSGAIYLFFTFGSMWWLALFIGD